MALDKFPLPYVFDVQHTSTYATKSVKFYSQKKQVAIQSVHPVKSWQINVRGDYDDLKTLKGFFNAHYGDAYPFIFVDEDGNEQTVRFQEPKLNVKEYRDFNINSPTNGTVVGFEGTITLEEAL